MAKKLSKTHYVLVGVTFDRPCGAAEAVAHVKDCVHGEFNTTPFTEKGPESFRIRSVKRPKQA